MPAYELCSHASAKRTLGNMDSQIRERITDTLTEMSEREDPSNHNQVEKLEGYDLLKVRVGDYRVICEFTKPYLDILLIEHRSTVYNNLETAKSRAQ